MRLYVFLGCARTIPTTTCDLQLDSKFNICFNANTTPWATTNGDGDNPNTMSPHRHH